MFNKYQRDKHLQNMKDLQRRKMVTGYLQDQYFDQKIQISRKLASPSRSVLTTRHDESGLGFGLGYQPPNEAEKITMKLDQDQQNKIARRRKRTMDLANRSRTRVQSWLTRLDYNHTMLDCLDEKNNSLKKLVDFHDFRPEDEKKEISNEKFRVNNYKTPVARREQAMKEAQILLSSGETGCYKKPFIFRAHDPLRSSKKQFSFKHTSEQERLKDVLERKEIFETANFDKTALVKEDLHRTLDKTKWLSTEHGGFAVAPKQKIPDTHRLSTNTSFIEPYEDPELLPGFVRSERAYLKQKSIRKAKRDKELLEQSFNMTLKGSKNKNAFLKDLDKTSTMNMSGMSFSQGRTSQNNYLTQSQMNQKKASASLSRKQANPLSNIGSTSRNSFYDTYQKIQTLKAHIRQAAFQKQSLCNFPVLSPMAQSGIGFHSGRDSKMNESKTVGFKINTSFDEPSTYNHNSPKEQSALGSSNAMANFNIKAKASFKLQQARQCDLANTLEFFFDWNKLYLKMSKSGFISEIRK